MSKDNALGFLLVLLFLGGIVLLARRPAPAPALQSCCGDSPLKIVPEAPRYRNKEVRRIEYNSDGLPTLIEITRDYSVA